MVEAASNSKYLTRLILATDNEEIERVASQYQQLEVVRYESKYSEPGQPTFGTFRHIFQQLIEKHDQVPPAAVVLLRVTAPLCLPSDIDTAIEILINKNDGDTTVVSVVESDVYPERMYIIERDSLLRAREKTPENKFPLPRQIFKKTYIRNGAIYATAPSVILGGSLFGTTLVPYVMPKERSININDEIDFILAEELLKRRKT
jgi:CMP-N-acetylneuraminic acid synthetase